MSNTYLAMQELCGRDRYQTLAIQRSVAETVWRSCNDLNEGLVADKAAGNLELSVQQHMSRHTEQPTLQQYC